MTHPANAPIVAYRNLVRIIRPAGPSTPSTVHLSGCHMANRRGSRARPWRWADEVSLEVLQAVIYQRDYRCCRRCLPEGVK